MTEGQSKKQSGGGGRRGRGSRRRRRGGGRRPQQGGGGNGGQPLPNGEPLAAAGVLECRPEGYGFLRRAESNYLPRPDDVFVPRDLIRTHELQEGVELAGEAVPTGRGGPAMTRLDSINRKEPEAHRDRRFFADLTAMSPDERIQLETGTEPVETRVVDLVAPIGKGQRCLVVAPPKAGKTTLLQQIAHAVTVNHPEIFLIVLLVDERPEEVTDWRRRVEGGEVIASSSDEMARNHVKVAEIVIERAKRLVETGHDVMILLDSLTRLSRAYNVEQRGSGKILSGGIDSRTMENPRRFFGAARNAEEGGSLTIIASCLVDTGSRMDEVIFQEFKGTGNTEIILDRRLFERRVFPCIDINATGTRKEERILPEDWLPKVHLLRRALSQMAPVDAVEALLKKLALYESNEAFLATLAK